MAMKVVYAQKTHYMSLCVFAGTIVTATDKALSALRKLREGTNKKRAREEVSGLFHTKRQKSYKVSAWKHKFCCLAYKNQKRIPTTEAEKEELYQAGLGDKEISFDDLHISQQEFHDNILLVSRRDEVFVLKRYV